MTHFGFNPKTLPSGLRALLGLAPLILVSMAGSAQVLLGTATPNGNGTYTYAYTVNNVSGSFDVQAITLDFTLNPSEVDWDQLSTFDGGEVQVPSADWYADGDFGSGPSSQGFLSLSPSSDILVGTSLSGFSFVSANPPGTISYLLDGTLGETASGLVAGPVAVPELSAFGLMTGFVLLGWVVARDRSGRGRKVR